MCQALGSRVADTVIVQAVGDRGQARGQGPGVLGGQGLAADTPAGTIAPFDRGGNRITSPWLLSESGEAAGPSGGSFLPGTPQVQIPALQLAA